MAAALIILSAAATAATLTGQVIAVTDGDTIIVLSGQQKRKIRLLGIDAPESKQESGQIARSHLAELILGKQVTVIWAKVDRYKRLLGVVIVGSVDANLEQLKSGCAWYYRAYESDIPEIERALYVAAESAAREEKSGLWGQPNPLAPWVWRRHK